MGLVLQVQGIWLLLNLCMFCGSSDFGQPLSPESSSLPPPIDAQAPHSRFEPGLVLQHPIVSPSGNSPPVYQATSAPTQSPHDPPLYAEPPHHSGFPAAEPTHDSAPPLVSETPFQQPHYLTPPPTVESRNDSAAPSAIDLPKDITPPPVVEPPQASSVPVAAKPPQALSSPFLSAPPPYVGPQHASILPPSAVPLPVLSPPSHLSPSQAYSPIGSLPSNDSVSPPPMLPFPLESPPPAPLTPPADEPTLYEPPPPAGDTQPFKLSPPVDVTPSHAPSLLPGAEPPRPSSLPLAAKPPEALTQVPPPESQPVFPSIPPISAIQPPPMLPNVSSPPPELEPPIVSSPPPQPVPPTTPASPPQQMPQIASSPPPHLPPLKASPPAPPLGPSESPPSPALPPSSSLSPPVPPLQAPPMLPNVSSPPPELAPPIVSSPPPQLMPPIVSSPPPRSMPPIVSSPPQQMPPITSSPPPQLPPLNASSPSPPLVPSESPPTPALPPSSSFSPPLMVPPPMDASPVLPTPSSPVPQNASSIPPQLGPPNASPSSPQSVLPPLPSSPPTFEVPSVPLVSPPSIMPSPDPLESPPVVPPHDSAMFSPPITSHAVSPLPQLVPPHSPHSSSPPLAEPPQVFPSPPPLSSPVTPPPASSIVTGAVPPLPRASPPPLFASPPFASPPQKNSSHASMSPPVPSHVLPTPPPSELSYPSVPPSPSMKGTEHAMPPHSSQRKAPQDGAPPPFVTSPDTSPPSGTSSRAVPPTNHVKLESPPPPRQHSEAPKHSAPLLRSNASEPHAPPLPAPVPSDKHGDDTAPAAPKVSPSEPKFDRKNATAPIPSSSQVNPAINGSHHAHHHSPGFLTDVAPLPSPQGTPDKSSAASPVPSAPPGSFEIPFLPPEVSPSRSSPRYTKKPLSPRILSLPPPPPNADCAYLTCPAPSTNTPPGSPCGCVWPMQVGLRLGVALYTFFPLVSELAQEIAGGVFLKQSQVRIMGASAAAQEPEKSIVLVDLVPLDDKFDNITSHLIFDRFWHRQVIIDKSIFGDYDVLYVRYPGLPPSPPMAPADIAVINGMPYSVGDPNGSKLHPLGVDVTKQRHKHRLTATVIAVIVLSAVLGLLMCCSIGWILVFKHTIKSDQLTQTPRAVASLGRSSGPAGHSTGSGQSSSLSLGSSLATYTGSARTFSVSEIEKATDNFDPSRILGEGGFGLVHGGLLEDDTRVAVKVLKRDDQQGGREFLAEVEMLSRLHHRNLVKLIGICTDERMRCLVYELIPNGSVDSHLHGRDKDIAPLDWASRMKIALGAARGLAYLHEDSSPRVIHRDFKSSNILLENDFTPKVSDFGLARTAMDEENRHISTRVMGTFGYVAPEYAMTGHLLVKSDVYSYGVVLLELLTGRKPVDMSQPAGEENLVSWTRPFLTSREGLESIIDPSLGSEVPYESVAKVAAIASMCVQPEVSHRPFMGEVVQALKLVCSECDDSKDGGSRSHSRENLSIDFDAKESPVLETPDTLQGQFSLNTYAPRHDVEKGLSVSETFSGSATLGRQASDSYRRHSASGPIRTTRGPQFWQRIRGQSQGSVSEHGIMYRLWGSSH